jgi:hypothetical protein
MKCPVCIETDLVMTDRQGVEIDYCPKCRGVWLDRGELDKVIERSATMTPAQAPPRLAITPNAMITAETTTITTGGANMISMASIRRSHGCQSCSTDLMTDAPVNGASSAVTREKQIPFRSDFDASSLQMHLNVEVH